MAKDQVYICFIEIMQIILPNQDLRWQEKLVQLVERLAHKMAMEKHK